MPFIRWPCCIERAPITPRRPSSGDEGYEFAPHDHGSVHEARAHLKVLREDKTGSKGKELKWIQKLRKKRDLIGKLTRAASHCHLNVAAWDRFRIRILELLEDVRFEMFLLVLIFCDVLMVVIEALLDNVFTMGHETHHQERGSSLGQGSPVCPPQCSADVALCHPARAGDIATICRIISIAILFVFAAELSLKLCLAPQSFIRHFGHMFDASLVSLSIAFEFTLHHSHGQLLLFFRLWRVVRIAHGLYEEMEFIKHSLETENHLEKALDTNEVLQRYIATKGLTSDFSKFRDANSVLGMRHKLKKGH